jgi:hypothetical protein
MCPAHWRALPARLKVAILRAYRPGQEVDKTPSAEYLVAQRKACMWVAVKEGRRTVGDAAVEVMRWIPEAKAFTNIPRRGPLAAAEVVDEMDFKHGNAGLVALAETVLDEMKGATS